MVNSDRERFVPSGVDAQSWMGFEQRIQERRFRALIDSINRAIDHGDVVEARVGLEEARELRPESPELDAAEARIDAMTIAVQARDAAGDGIQRSRVTSAVLLLLIGIALLMGIDWMRSTDAAVDSNPEAPAPTLQVGTPQKPAEPAVTIVPPPAPQDIAQPANQAGTPGGAVERALRRETLPRQTFVPATNREIPDDYVWVPARRRAPAAPAPPIAAAAATASPGTDTADAPRFFDDATLKPFIANQ